MTYQHSPEQIEFWHATSYTFRGARALENRRAAFQAEYPGTPIPGDDATLEEWVREKDLREAAQENKLKPSKPKAKAAPKTSAGQSRSRKN